jgi:hypothetical protein
MFHGFELRTGRSSEHSRAPSVFQTNTLKFFARLAISIADRLKPELQTPNHGNALSLA